jgi:hypothetical protein
MQLNQPIPPDPSGGENPYDFILANNQKSKSKIPLKTGSKTGRILLVVAAAALLLVVFGILFSVLTSSGNNARMQLIEVAQTQTEISRVAGLGSTQARDLKVQAFAKTVSVSMLSQQIKTTNYLSSQGQKVDSKILLATKNTKTDQALKTAGETNQYDEQLTTILNNSLSAYQTKLTKAYAATESKSQKDLYQQLSDEVAILVKSQSATN